MTIQTPPQFTPAQVLDAGRRAELEGRAEFAAQFYRHLIDYYPGTAEAATAEDGLKRIGRKEFTQQDGLRRNATEDLPGFPPKPPGLEALGSSNVPAPKAGTTHAPGAMSGPQLGPPPHLDVAPQRRPAVGKGPDTQHARRSRFELPEPNQDYRAGRTIARMLTWLGGFTTVASIAYFVVSLAYPGLADNLPPALRVGLSIAVAGVGFVLGLLMILLGQLCRAIFEHANAARDLATITRTRAQGEGLGHHSPYHGEH